MIKLTRGALTMLLAQYRGILKNAWIKNFAVAAALATTVFVGCGNKEEAKEAKKAEEVADEKAAAEPAKEEAKAE